MSIEELVKELAKVKEDVEEIKEDIEEIISALGIYAQNVKESVSELEDF